MATRNTDHLANERTFLAYLRTSLAFIAFGFVLARFALVTREFSLVTHQAVPSNHLSTYFGVAMALSGVAIAVYGAHRYRQAHDAILADQAAPMPVRAASALGVILAIIGFIVALTLLLFK